MERSPLFNEWAMTGYFRFKFFISEMMQQTARLWGLMRLLVIMGFWQDMISCLTPFVTHFMATGEETSIYNIYCWSLHYTSGDEFSSLRTVGVDYAAFALTIRLVVTTLTVSLMYVIFSNSAGVQSWWSGWRSLLFFFAPAPLLFPTTLSFAQAVSKTMTEGTGSLVNYNMISMFVVFLGTAFESYFYAPLFSASTITGNASFPSRLIGDNFYLVYQLGQQVLLLFAIAAPARQTMYYFGLCAIITNVYSFYSLWKLPFGSLFDSAILLAVMAMKIVFPLVCCVVVNYEKQWEMNVFYALLIATGLAIIIFYVLLRRRVSMCQKRENPLLLLQWTLVYSHKANNADLVSLFRNVVEVDPDLRMFLGLMCAKLMYDEIDKDMFGGILELSMCRINNWADEMTAFELIRSYCTLAEHMGLSHDMQELEDHASKIRDITDKFWQKMIAGDINEGTECLGARVRESAEVMFKFGVFNSFFGVSPGLVMFRRSHPELVGNLTPKSSFLDRHSQYGFHLYKRSASVSGVSRSSSHISAKDSARNETALSGETSHLDAIQANVRRLTRRLRPMYGLILALALALCLCVLGLTVYPYWDALTSVNQWDSIADSMVITLAMMKDWAAVSIMLLDGIACNDAAALTQEVLADLMGVGIPEPDGIASLLDGSLMENIGDLFEGMYASLNEALKVIAVEKNPEVKDALNFWREPAISRYTFKRYDNESIDLVDMTNVQLTPVAYITDMVRVLINHGSECAAACDCGLVTYFKNDMYNFMMVCADINNAMHQGCVNVATYVDSLLEKSNAADMDIAVIFANIAFWTLVSGAMFFGYLVQHRMICRYFRPSRHPTSSSALVKGKLRGYGSPRLLIGSIIALFVAAGLYSLQNYVFWTKVERCHNNAIGELRLFAEIGNISFHMTSVLTYAIVRDLMNGVDGVFDFSVNDLLTTAVTRLKGAEGVLSQHMRAVSSSATMREAYIGLFCDTEESDHTNVTFHDIYRCWPMSHQVPLLLYLSWQSLDYERTHKNQGFDHFLHSQHVYLRHFTTVSTQFVDQLLVVSSSLAKLRFYAVVEWSLSGVYLAAVLAIVGGYTFSLLTNFQELRRLFDMLNPKYIASEQCLMDFIVDREEVNAVGVSRSGSMFEVLESGNILLIVINEERVIVGLTKPVLVTFGYRIEHLVGQSIDILVPKTDRDGDKNAVIFYDIIERLQSGAIDDSDVCWVIGRCSDDTVVHQRVKVMRVEMDDSPFFVIELRTALEEVSCEELILCHADLFNRYTRAYIPVSMFCETRYDGVPLERNFESAVLLSIGFESQYIQITDYADFDMMRGLREFTMRWFSGRDNAVVVDSTCSNSLILFATDTCKEETVLRALEFAFAFSNFTDHQPTGAIVLCNEGKLVFYPPPRELSVDLDSMKPALSVEAIAEELTLISSLIPLMLPNMLIVSGDIHEIAPYIPTESIPNSVGHPLEYVTLRPGDLLFDDDGHDDFVRNMAARMSM